MQTPSPAAFSFFCAGGALTILESGFDVVDLQEQPLSVKNHLLQSGHFNALPSSLSLLHLKQRKYFPLSPPHKLQAILNLTNVAF
jgi:hypothetical protein